MCPTTFDCSLTAFCCRVLMVNQKNTPRITSYPDRVGLPADCRRAAFIVNSQYICISRSPLCGEMLVFAVAVVVSVTPQAVSASRCQKPTMFSPSKSRNHTKNNGFAPKNTKNYLKYFWAFTWTKRPPRRPQ